MMIRVTSVSVIPAMWRGRLQTLLRWREWDPDQPQPQHIREKCHYWFVDRDEAIEVRDAMRRGDTFEMAFAKMKARCTEP